MVIPRPGHWADAASSVKILCMPERRCRPRLVDRSLISSGKLALNVSDISSPMQCLRSNAEMTSDRCCACQAAFAASFSDLRWRDRDCDEAWPVIPVWQATLPLPSGFATLVDRFAHALRRGLNPSLRDAKGLPFEPLDFGDCPCVFDERLWTGLGGSLKGRFGIIPVAIKHMLLAYIEFRLALLLRRPGGVA